MFHAYGPKLPNYVRKIGLSCKEPGKGTVGYGDS